MNDSSEVKGLVHTVRESFFGFKADSAKTETRLIALMGVFTALCIVFERTVFIPVGDNSRYSFTFVIVALAGVTLGSLRGAIAASIADIIGSLMLYGNVCPLITVCVFLSAITYGIFLYKKRNILTIVSAVLVDQLFCSLILKTGALAIWYNGGMHAYPAVFLTRLVQVLIMIPIEIAVLLILNRFLFGFAKKAVGDFLE